jgi:hypothetical protein
MKPFYPVSFTIQKEKKQKARKNWFDEKHILLDQKYS